MRPDTYNRHMQKGFNEMKKKTCGKRANGTIWIHDPLNTPSNELEFNSIDECIKEIDNKLYYLTNTNGLKQGEHELTTDDIASMEEYYKILKQDVLRLKAIDLV